MKSVTDLYFFAIESVMMQYIFAMKSVTDLYFFAIESVMMQYIFAMKMRFIIVDQFYFSYNNSTNYGGFFSK